MDKRISKCLLILLSLVLVPAVIFMALAGLAMADDAGTTARTLNRDLEPVIVTGTVVNAFLGVPVNQLFVYAYIDGAWTQIPAQVDEVTAAGVYTDTEDGLLDANDELVFMAQDLGDQAVGMAPAAGGWPISTRWYELEVTDPLDPTKRGWAYVVHSNRLERTFTADYVGFNTFLHRINAASYRLGFATPRPWIKYLTLNGNVVDILDRTKTRLCSGDSCLTERLLPGLQDNLIKDGPVRLIARGGRVLAYGAMAAWTITVPDTAGINSIRFSTDFNAAATGATFYSAVVPDGVTVDGVPDNVPESPVSPWWQLSTSMGTIVQVSDTSPISGTQTNYYVDDFATDSSDTGDRKHYADTGVHIVNPNSSFAYTFTIYFLPGSQPNLGETYAAYFSQPLVATAQLQQLDLPVKVYLPALKR